MQPPQIVNPVLGGQDVRNVAGNQIDIRNADPRDIRLSNGYVKTQFIHTMIIQPSVIAQEIYKKVEVRLSLGLSAKLIINKNQRHLTNSQSPLQHSNGASTRSNQRLTSGDFQRRAW